MNSWRSPARVRFPNRIIGAFWLLIASFTHSHAQSITIGVAAPLSGPFEILGKQIEAGAQAFAAADGSAEVVLGDDNCSPEGGKRVARSFVSKGVQVATGFVCTEAAETALPILSEAGIPIISTGVRTERVRDRLSGLPPVYRLSETRGQEADAVSRIIVDRWRGELFAIVDDGTIYARELAEALRNAAETAGLKPAYIDTFRPQLENQIGLAARLKKAGVTHLFAAGDRADIAIIARDAEQVGLSLTIAGGEALLAADVDGAPLPEGIFAIAPDSLVRALPEDPLTTTTRESGFWLLQYSAMQVAAKIARDLTSGEPNDGKSGYAALNDQAFQTRLGPIRFDENGHNLSAEFSLYRYNGTAFVKAGS